MCGGPLFISTTTTHRTGSSRPHTQHTEVNRKFYCAHRLTTGWGPVCFRKSRQINGKCDWTNSSNGIAYWVKPSSHYMILKRGAELCSSHYMTCSLWNQECSSCWAVHTTRHNVIDPQQEVTHYTSWQQLCHPTILSCPQTTFSHEKSRDKMNRKLRETARVPIPREEEHNSRMGVRQKLVLQTVCAMISSEKIYTQLHFKKEHPEHQHCDIGIYTVDFPFS